MTSLSRQLQQLAVPYAQAAFAPDKSKKSLLFDPKEAATLDRETIFALGSNGLEELQSIDETFEEYELTLFNESSRDWERGLQTKDINEELDETINEFLIRVSPYLLLKSSHKALEWLIYRYHIHQMNVDTVMMCILPYHQTNIFSRILQLLDINDSASKWNWLVQVQKSGVVLPRLSLINHVIQDKGFLSFICNFPTHYIKVLGRESEQLRTVISFYACTVLGAIQNKHQISENIMSVLVPTIIQGLKSKCKAYKAATYMILTQLAVQVKMKEDLLNSLIPALTKKVNVDLAKELLLCLTILYQTQKIGKLPKKSFNHLSKLPGLTENISSLSIQYDMSSFLASYLQRLVPRAIKCTADSASSSDGSDTELLSGMINYTSLLTSILQDIQLPKKITFEVASELLTSLLALREDKNEEEWREVANVLLSIMERKYTMSLDKAVEDKICEMKTEEERAALNDILKFTTSAVKYQMVTDDSTTLYLSLHHTRSSLRTLAVEQLANNLNQNLTLPEGFAEGTLIARLHDDSPSVVKAVMKMGMNLLRVFSKEKLASELLKVAHKSLGQPERNDVTVMSLDLLTNTEVRDGAADLTFQLLPFILLRDMKPCYLQAASGVMSSEHAMKDKLLKSFSPGWLTELRKAEQNRAGLSTKVLASLNNVLIQGLISSILNLDINRVAVVEELFRFSKDNNYTKLLAAAVCCQVTVQCEDLDEVVVVLEPLLDLVLEPGIFDLKEVPSSFAIVTPLKACMGHWVSYLHTQDRLNIDMLVWVIDQILSRLPNLFAQVDETGTLWWKADSKFIQCVVRIFDRLFSEACQVLKNESRVKVWRDSISKLLAEPMDPVYLSKLLCLIITQSESTSEMAALATLQVGSLHLLRKVLEKHASQDFIRKTPVMETLMVTLVHEAPLMRQGALDCVEAVKSACGKQLEGLHVLLKKIGKRSEEISADPEYFPLIIRKLSDGDEDVSDQFMTWIAGGQAFIQVTSKLLTCVQFAPHQVVVEKSLPFVVGVLKTFDSTTSVGATSDHMKVLEQILSRFENHVTEKTLDVLLECLKVNRVVDGKSAQSIALQQTSRELFRALPGIAEQKKLISAILDVAEKTQSSTVLALIHQTLKQFKLDGMHVAHELSPPSGEASAAETVKQRRRSKLVATPATNNAFTWKRATILLEALQTRKKVHDPHVMLSLLFGVLNNLLTKDVDELEYKKRLVLSCIHNLTKKWPDEEDKPTQDTIHMESLVKCVSNSTSLQTQQKALMVMASVANFFPDHLLHHVMSIFTFVGGGLLQQDDNYSLQVITTTVQTIIPALLQAQKDKKQSSEKLDELVASILQVFVDARHAVPKHRCMLVFQTLVETLGADKYLWMIAVLVIESAARNKNIRSSLTEEQEWTETGVDADIMFSINIYEQFSARTQMSALTNVLLFLQKLTLLHNLESTPGKRKKQKLGIVVIATMSPQEVRLFQYHMTKLLASVLQHEAFIGRIVADIEGKASDDASRSYCKEFVQEVLAYMTKVASQYGHQATKETQAKFWRAMIGKVYDILDKVNYLLPTDSLLEVVGSLVTHDLVAIRRKALDLLGNKLQQLEADALKRSDVKSLLKLVEVLTTIAEDQSGGADPEFINCRQHALLCLKLITKLLAHQHPNKFIKLYDVVVPLIKDENLPMPVLGVSVLCVAELCAELKAHSISKLGVFVPPLIDLLKRQDYLVRNDMLLTCSLVAVQKLLSTLPHFLSPYLLNILLEICQLFDCVNLIEDKNKKAQSMSRIVSIKQLLCTNISPRVLIPTMVESCESIMKSSKPNGLTFIAKVAEEHITNMKKEDLSSHQNALISFFCNALNLRNSKLKLTLEKTDEIEDNFINAVLATVVRLSENAFRPMYYKFYDWACRDDDQTGRNRQLPFYKMSYRLAERLKGLFNLFIGHSMQSMCQALSANCSKTEEVDYYGTKEDDTRKSCILLTNIINCLHQCMVHDNEGLFQKDVFKMVMSPLVDQIDNLVGGEDEYERRITQSVVPCISQFAVASKDDAAWKTLNYQVALKTRNTSAKVRFATLQVEEEIAKKLGEEFMVLLPEAIPFLAELMEDEVEEVEQKCQEVIRSIEQAVDEDLQKYF